MALNTFGIYLHFSPYYLLLSPIKKEKGAIPGGTTPCFFEVKLRIMLQLELQLLLLPVLQLLLQQLQQQPSFQLPS